MENDRIPVAILGATGSVGQRFVSLLDGHPWFRVAAITGSGRTAGRRYAEACHWVLPQPIPAWAGGMVLQESDPALFQVPLAFSALPSQVAREIEPAFARAGVAVCSNASAYRSEPDVPLLMPEINPQHLDLLTVQQRRRGWKGCLVTNPNCTSAGFTVALRALQAAFGLRRALVVSLQALSGAGYPGVASLDVIDNVIPWISGEEAKMEWEPLKMLGDLNGEEVHLAELDISAHANRVPVSDGHMICLSVELAKRPSLEAARAALADYRAPAISAGLPSSPRPVIALRDQEDRPQPRLDRMEGRGMTTVIGRLRDDPWLHLKMVVLSHNTIRGAAGGSIYNAELMVHRGLISV